MNRSFLFPNAFTKLSTVLLIGIFLLTPQPAEASESGNCVSCEGSPEDAHLLFASYFNTRAFNSDLILNNKGPEPLPFEMTIHSLRGERLELGPFVLQEASVQILDLKLNTLNLKLSRL